MSMHKGLIGKSDGGASCDNGEASVKQDKPVTNPLGFVIQPSDKTLADYIGRKVRQDAFDTVAKEKNKKSEQWYVDRRIACWEHGYPLSEARFADVFEYIDYLENK